MSRSRWQECIGWTSGDGTALTASTTATSILPAGPAKPTLPNNFFQEVGDRLYVRAAGRMSTVVTTPGTLTLEVRFGGSIVVFTSGAMALNIVAQTNDTWKYEAELECRSVGSGTSATLLGIGEFASRTTLNAPAVGTTTGVGVVLLPDTAPAVGSGFDSTAGQAVDFYATWSISNANSIQCHQFAIYASN